MLLVSLQGNAQTAINFTNSKNLFGDGYYESDADSRFFKRKLFQRNSGAIVGLQRGKFNAIELGAEAHWRKISLLNPHVIGATANLEYNFSNHLLGYKAGMWMKRGRINLTYGANALYFTDFKEGNAFGIGPAVGFRFFGFHLINGYNFIFQEKVEETAASLPVNELYISLRYYFPVENKFTWDRKTMKKKKARKKERLKKKKQRMKEKKKKQKGGKPQWKIFSKEKKK